MTKPEDKPVDLNSLRQDIDSIDSQIHALLNRRARCAQQVAEVKQREFEAAKQFESDKGSSSAQQLLFYRPEREAQVLARVKEANQGPLADDTVAYIFREIMSACLALEKPMEVAYLGPEGTFTQAAALKHFGHAVISVPQATIDGVFSQVESGQCHYGVVPVENSTVCHFLGCQYPHQASDFGAIAAALTIMANCEPFAVRRASSRQAISVA